MNPLPAIDRLRELLNIGAGHAAGAFAELVGRTFSMQVPTVISLAGEPSWQEAVARHGQAPDRGTTGIFFEVDGSVSGIVALLLPAAARDALAHRLLGQPADSAAPELFESAIREAGNIVVSHVCSAIADTLGIRLVPSIPVLELEHAESKLVSLVAQRPTCAPLRFETEIVDRSGELRGRLILVPDTSTIV